MNLKKKKAVILGAGVTGLKAAAELARAGYAVHVLEKNVHIGGMAYSFQYKDVTLDYGPHKFYSQIKGIMPEYKELLGENCLTREKTNSLYLLGKYFRFPPNPFQLAFGINPLIIARCGISYCSSLLGSFFSPKQNISYEDYFLHGFGKGAYDLLFKDFCWKVWGDPKIISEELARRRIPVPNIKELAKNALTGAQDKPDVSAKYFYYPKQGFGKFSDILADDILSHDGIISLGAVPQEIITNGKKVTSLVYLDHTKKKQTLSDIDVFISTIHLKDLVALFAPKAPSSVADASGALRYRALRLCYVFLDKERALRDNWFFFPEQNVCFNRVSEQKSFSPFTVPSGKTVITAEITCDIDNRYYTMDDAALRAVVLADLEKVGILKKEEVIDFLAKKLARVYPVYAIGFREHLSVVLGYIHSFDNVYTIGRQGLFNYNNTDHCMDMANLTAQHILSNGTRADWLKIVQIFDTYKIVD
ncbi:MAG: NAD(P)-binding protein [Nanoarchaeota archaeon]